MRMSINTLFKFFQYFRLNTYFSDNMKIIPISKFPITLGQFLKLAEIVDDGVEAKIRIQYGEIKVNNEVETRRGRKLYKGDTITFSDQLFVASDKDG